MRILILILFVFLSGCAMAPTQRVTPFTYTGFKEICIIENPKVVKEGYLQAFKSALQKKGYAVKMLNEGAKKSDCEVTATYTANWSWDLALYMSFTKIKVYKNGEKSGEASYRPRGAFSKFINAAEKVQELVDQLFPSPSSSIVKAKL